jgi:NAD(P)-dependent dehydrogenase (short-subunit alcohol dehydrogenase family)
MGRVSGRVCIVTGAAQGIGRAIGEALLDEGADVCFADINGDQVAAHVARENAERGRCRRWRDGCGSRCVEARPGARHDRPRRRCTSAASM